MTYSLDKYQPYLWWDYYFLICHNCFVHFSLHSILGQKAFFCGGFVPKHAICKVLICLNLVRLETNPDLPLWFKYSLWPTWVISCVEIFGLFYFFQLVHLVGLCIDQYKLGWVTVWEISLSFYASSKVLFHLLTRLALINISTF